MFEMLAKVQHVCSLYIYKQEMAEKCPEKS